jgi:hypothetical protein
LPDKKVFFRIAVKCSVVNQLRFGTESIILLSLKINVI